MAIDGEMSWYKRASVVWSVKIMPSRPIAVAIVAAFFFLASAIAVVVGASLLFPNPAFDRLWEFNRPGAELFHSIGRGSGLFLLALACGTFSAAIGLLRGRRWAWWFALILFVIEVAGNIVSYFLVHDVLRSLAGALIALIFLLILFRPKVQAYCAQAGWRYDRQYR
jgi:hypothetical protein